MRSPRRKKTETQKIEKMKEAISQYIIVGCETTLSFGKYVMDHPAFVSGDFDTNFVKQHFDSTALQGYEEQEAQLAAQLAIHFLENQQTTASAVPAAAPSRNSGRWLARKWK